MPNIIIAFMLVALEASVISHIYFCVFAAVHAERGSRPVAWGSGVAGAATILIGIIIGIIIGAWIFAFVCAGN